MAAKKKINNTITAFFNKKGGTGKTGLSVEVAANFAKKGYRTLLIGLDAQGNAGQTFGLMTTRYSGSDSFKTFFDYLEKGKNAFNDCVQLSVAGENNLDGLFSSEDMFMADYRIGRLIEKGKNPQEAGNEVIEKIKELFKEIIETNNYEKIVIDCSPALSYFQIMVLHAVDEIIIPAKMSQHDISGIITLNNMLRTMSGSLNEDEPELVTKKIKFILPMVTEPRLIDQRENFEELDTFSGKIKMKVIPMEDSIPKATAFSNAIKKHRTTPVLIGHNNKATIAITKFVDKYLI